MKRYRYFLRQWKKTGVWEISRYQTIDPKQKAISPNEMDVYRWKQTPNITSSGVTKYQLMKAWLKQKDVLLKKHGIEVKEITQEEANRICREEYDVKQQQ